MPPDANKFAQLIELESPSVHNAPHLFMGGTQIDVTFSSQDPWFFFHHCMVDFLFSIWQSLDWNARTTSVPDSHIFDQIRSQGGCKSFACLGILLGEWPANDACREHANTSSGPSEHHSSFTRLWKHHRRASHVADQELLLLQIRIIE